MEPTLSRQLKIKSVKSVKDCNNIQNKVVFEFNQEQDSSPKLISTLKKYFLTSYSDLLITNKFAGNVLADHLIIR